MYSQLYSLEERWEAEALLCVCVRYCEPTKLLTLTLPTQNAESRI